MAFVVIDGGKAMAVSGQSYEGQSYQRQRDAGSARPSRRDVEAEARRRIGQTGFEEWRIREFATGATMPAALRYLEMQIRFVADAVSRMEQIPADFRSDIYWPSI